MYGNSGGKLTETGAGSPGVQSSPESWNSSGSSAASDPSDSSSSDRRSLRRRILSFASDGCAKRRNTENRKPKADSRKTSATDARIGDARARFAPSRSRPYRSSPQRPCSRFALSPLTLTNLSTKTFATLRPKTESLSFPRNDAAFHFLYRRHIFNRSQARLVS